MADIEAETLFRRANLLGSRIQEEIVFFDPEAGKYYATGTVGAEIWEFLEAPKTFSAICEHLLDVYDIDEATCKNEVSAFLKDMIDARMVVAEGSLAC
jgi:hypothetical protein